jgi:hypothetical protein
VVARYGKLIIVLYGNMISAALVLQLNTVSVDSGRLCKTPFMVFVAMLAWCS